VQRRIGIAIVVGGVIEAAASGEIGFGRQDQQAATAVRTARMRDKDRLETEARIGVTPVH
jgi:hypothetical protein